jgi:deoxyribodipyrimidine photo-lyase
VHWRVAADWMYGYLLDGDLASNHLSWQWVAGTFSTKPYLFNAENVAAYAPKATHAAWLSPGTGIDQSYEILEAIARGSARIALEPGLPAAVAEPALHATPPDFMASELPSLARRSVELVHPWNLGENDEPGYRLGVIHLPFHSRFPWSAQRWAFVLERMRTSCDAIFVGDLADLVPALSHARTGTTATLNPGYGEALQKLVDEQRPIRTLFPAPETMSTSFSQFYEKASGITLTRKAPPRETTKMNTHKQGRRRGSRR